MSVTIKDVAKKANVAPSTVSRVISNSPRISEATKRKVRGVMKEMGYHLNFNARVLVRKSTQTIGIVMKYSSSHSLDNPFFSELLRGISASCHENDFSINLTTGDSEEAIFKDVVKMVQGKRVDGVIVLYSKKDDKVVPYLKEAGCPFIMVGTPAGRDKEILYVDNDNTEASKEAANYLLKLGHTKIGFIGGDSHFEVTSDRLEGYIQALREANLPVHKPYMKTLEFETTRSYQIVSEIVNLSDPPTSLVISDDYNALSVLAALQEKNISLPEEMSVITFNNTMITRLSRPQLTTVDTQSSRLGYEAARNLIEQLQHPDIVRKPVIIPASIVERESCKPMKVK